MIVVLAMAFMTLPLQSHAQKAYKDATGGFMNVTQFVNCGAGCTASASNITPVDVGGYTSGMIAVNVTVVSGTSPSLTVNFQACDGNSGSAPATSNCATHTASTAITATGVYLIKVDHFSRWTTVSYTISGTTPSFTFTATAYFKPTS